MAYRLYREYERVPRSERMYAAVAGKRRERTSSIAPARKNKLVAPLELQGRCTTEVVDAYFEQVLRPARSPARVSVRDNARFHQSPTAQKLVEAPLVRCCFYRPTRRLSSPTNSSVKFVCYLSAVRASQGRRASSFGSRSSGTRSPPKPRPSLISGISAP